MQEYVNRNLNVYRLLASKELDIRRIAEQNPTMSAGDYFAKVERFLEEAPRMRSVLTQSGAPADNPVTPEDLDEIKDILAAIGHDKLDEDINYIRSLLAGGLSSVERAAQATAKLDALYERIKGARLSKRFRHVKPGAEIQDESNGWILLKKALEQWDNEEANRKLRILAVDDVMVVLNAITSALSADYEVFALKESAQVKDFLKHTTPELFLLDIEMPELNGYELVNVIRSFEEHKDTPVIFLTGNASLDNLKTAISIGACDFITKPINRDILLEKIQDKIVRKKAF